MINNFCICGCGEKIIPSKSRPNLYPKCIRGHHMRLKHHKKRQSKLTIENLKGYKRPDSIKKQISETMKTKKINVGSTNPMFGKIGHWANKNRPDMSGENHPLYGIKRPKLAKNRLGSKNPAWKGGLPNCKDCNKKLKHPKSLRCVKCNSKFFSGKNSPSFGKLPPATNKWVKYKNINFRSSWEANFAKWLDLSDIKWLYESETFDLGNTTYTPDFYLPEFDCYIEIKGYWYSNGKIKFHKFQKNFDVLLFDEYKLKEYGILI